ncbi:MAG: hypothetical protein JRJ31_22390 [Deltaproteobacteria bacterium]|nr:hypothetical protein [Deltaproteobacteria bacterium]
MNITTPNKKPDIKQLQSWVSEAHWASSTWRAESWQDCEMYDGAQWTDEEKEKATDAGVDPLVVNRTFPVVNLILGSQQINRIDIDAKGRTQADSEIAQVMTESIRFVLDQANGQFLISQAFKDAIIPGVGWLAAGLNADPREEQITVDQRDWKEVFWDPFASPWISPRSCRYVFHQRWMDLSDLQALFPEKTRGIQDVFNELTGKESGEWGAGYYDEATDVEEIKRTMAGSDWADADRKRVRPVELWYHTYEKAWFAMFPDGRTIEIRDDMPATAQLEIVQASQQVVSAVVRRMRVAVFLGELLLQDIPTPFPHDEFPFVPFVGYTDRYGFPYGVPRQIRDMDIEVNKRRSMALALLKSRRVLAESDVTSDSGGLQHLYEEANSLDGFIVVDPGKLDRIQIIEQQAPAPSQVALLQESEREIQELAGTNAEQLGYESNVTSGVALQKRMNQASTMTATLFGNLRRSLKLLGQQLEANIKGFWQGEKVLRVTDRLSGAERFVVLNQPIQMPNGMVAVKNNITQGKYDIVVTEAPKTDTVREQNLNLLQEVIRKSPPEVAPPLLSLAFELMDLPNKEILLTKLKPLLGQPIEDEDLSPQEVKAKALEQIQGQQEAQAQQAQLQQAMVELEMENKRLENEKLLAEIESIRARAGVEQKKVQVDEDKVKLDAYKTGFETQQKALQMPEPEVKQ